MTLNFGRMCVANFLSFASVYMFLPVLSLVVPERLGISVPQVGGMFLAFAAAMFAVGPFHAYLCDEYKRKDVLLCSTLVVLAAMPGYAFADSYAKLLLLASVQGACFGLATTAGITVAIDITMSARRSAGNKAYALAARLGMLAGVCAGCLVYWLYGFRTVAYAAVAVGALGMLAVSRVYVAFRAPIGLGLCSLDRFLLPRAWLPALNVLLVAFVPGVLFPLLYTGELALFAALGILALLTIPFTKMFVKLSHHCQRGTANTTCQLAIETGFLAGLAAACRLSDACLPASDVCQLYRLAGVAALLALLFFVLLTRPYYKRKRVR